MEAKPSTVEKQGERPTEVAVGQRWNIPDGPYAGDIVLTRASGDSFRFKWLSGKFAGREDGADMQWLAIWKAAYLGPPSPVSGSVPRPVPAKGQRWRGGRSGFNKREPFTLSHFDGAYWRMRGDEFGGWEPESFTDGTLEYVDDGEPKAAAFPPGCKACGCNPCLCNAVPQPTPVAACSECDALRAEVARLAEANERMHGDIDDLVNKLADLQTRALANSKVAMAPGRDEPKQPWVPSVDPLHWIEDV